MLMRGYDCVPSYDCVIGEAKHPLNHIEKPFVSSS